MSGTNKTSKFSLSAGFVAAIASSVCCVGPLVAGIAGISGAASSFSWIEPIRPYLIVFTVLALGFAFYQAYRPKKAKVDCCETSEPEKKRKFFQSKTFLWTVTLFSAFFLTLPYYSGIFHPAPATNSLASIEKGALYEITFAVDGMTCTGCEHHIEGDLANTEGVLSADANYDMGTTQVSFDQSRLSKDEVIAVIQGTGYQVTGEVPQVPD